MKELNLRTGAFVQDDNGGQLTSVDIFKKKYESTNKGTLFIDEAYMLMTSFAGKHVLDELLTVAENRQDEITIILSGERHGRHVKRRQHWSSRKIPCFQTFHFRRFLTAHHLQATLSFISRNPSKNL